jgi:hypothetical protein
MSEFGTRTAGRVPLHPGAGVVGMANCKWQMAKADRHPPTPGLWKAGRWAGKFVRFCSPGTGRIGVLWQFGGMYIEKLKWELWMGCGIRFAGARWFATGWSDCHVRGARSKPKPNLGVARRRSKPNVGLARRGNGTSASQESRSVKLSQAESKQKNEK